MAGSPLISPVFTWFTTAGLPASGYKLNTYFAGTTTPQATFTDATLATPNANPVILNANGYAPVFLGSGTYKFVLTDASNNTIWTEDNISQSGVPSGGGGGGGTTSSEWIVDAAAPTFISATQFSLTGDRTGTYHINRRVRTLNTAGLVYATVTAVSFGGGITTVTVSPDSGQLDSGLSQVSYGILDSVNVSYPANIGGGGGGGGGSSGGNNLLYNGDFSVWQRGAGGSASFTGIAARAYTADRWQAVHTGGNVTVTQVTGSVSRYGFKLQRTAGNAITANVQMAQSLEINDCIGLATAGTPLTISLNLKAGANFSAGGENVLVQIFAGKDAADTNVLAGYTSSLTVAQSSFGITSTSTRYSLSGTVPAASGYTEFGVIIGFMPTGTAGADDSVTVEKVKLEPNSSSTAFVPTQFGAALNALYRYYWKTFVYGTLPAQNAGTTNAYQWIAAKTGAAAENAPSLFWPTVMRATPTVVTFNPSAANVNARDIDAAADCSATGGSFNSNNYNATCTGNAGTAIGNRLNLHITADADIP